MTEKLYADWLTARAKYFGATDHHATGDSLREALKEAYETAQAVHVATGQWPMAPTVGQGNEAAQSAGRESPTGQSRPERRRKE